MEIADSFVPTAGAVGIFPLVTYFFWWWLLIFLGTFIASLAIRPAATTQLIQPALVLTAVIAAISGFYYQIQGHYHMMLAELATVTSADDRQVLIRESYNAIGQYRFMDWAVTIPLLLIQVILLRPNNLVKQNRTLITLLIASFFMVLAGYIGHQQLGFDNEIQVGPKLIWGAISMLGYGIIVRTLVPVWKSRASQSQPNEQWVVRLVTLCLGTFGLVYPIGYLLTFVAIDFNIIHVIYTVADLTSKVGMGIAIYFTLANASQSTT